MLRFIANILCHVVVFARVWSRSTWSMFLMIHSVQFNSVNSSPPKQNGRHFGDDVFRCIFVNKNFIVESYSAIIWANVDEIHWRVYAALGGDELKACMLSIKTYWYNTWYNTIQSLSFIWHELQFHAIVWEPFCDLLRIMDMPYPRRSQFWRQIYT